MTNEASQTYSLSNKMMIKQARKFKEIECVKEQCCQAEGQPATQRCRGLWRRVVSCLTTKLISLNRAPQSMRNIDKYLLIF